MSMALALEWAEKGQRAQEVPVGAVLVMDGCIIAQDHNRVEEKQCPFAHAELLVLYHAHHFFKTKYLEAADLYVTLEPCLLCASAIRLSRIRRLYFGAYDPKGGGVDHGPRLLFKGPTEVVGGIEEQKSIRLLKQFFSKKRGLSGCPDF